MSNQSRIADIFRQLDWVKRHGKLALEVAEDSNGNQFNIVKGLKLTLRHEDYRTLSELVEWMDNTPEIISDGLSDRFWEYTQVVKLNLLNNAVPSLDELTQDGSGISSDIVRVSASMLRKSDLYADIEVTVFGDNLDVLLCESVYIEIIKGS